MAVLDVSDTTLAQRAKAGDQKAFEALYHRYEGLIYQIASCYYAPGLERQDFVQEGRIALYHAVRTYVPERASFRTLLGTVINRKLSDVVRTALREKHGPLNGATHFDAHTRDGVPLFKVLVGGVEPYARVESRQRLESLRVALGTLTGLEYDSLMTIAEGYRYDEVVGVASVKSVDNAVQRARQKLRLALAT